MFSEMIFKLLEYQGVSKEEINKFSGDLFEYQYFGSIFNQVVEKKISDQMGRLTRLIKSTGGKAK